MSINYLSFCLFSRIIASRFLSFYFYNKYFPIKGIYLIVIDINNEDKYINEVNIGIRNNILNFKILYLLAFSIIKG
jgi:hypothetical protein